MRLPCEFVLCRPLEEALKVIPVIPTPYKLLLSKHYCVKLEYSQLKKVIRFNKHNCSQVLVVFSNRRNTLIPNGKHLLTQFVWITFTHFSVTKRINRRITP